MRVSWKTVFGPSGARRCHKWPSFNAISTSFGIRTLGRVDWISNNNHNQRAREFQEAPLPRAASSQRPEGIEPLMRLHEERPIVELFLSKDRLIVRLL